MEVIRKSDAAQAQPEIADELIVKAEATLDLAVTAGIGPKKSPPTVPIEE